MRFRMPYVSAASYDWALRTAERCQQHAEKMEQLAERESAKADALLAKVQELTDKIVAMKKENFVIDVPITNTALSTDEADEFAAEEDANAKKAMLRRKLGT